MDAIYLIIVIVLFALAISDLIVGVSNDAVNFLNSAIGAKAAPFRIIMIIAALGIVAGATFSSGMMEVARKGIFHPEHFYFSEIMIIFLAVMITDVILLDMFNTFGLPTSTTVSIVFELLGAAVAVSIIKIVRNPNALELGEYINTGKAMAIIGGILLSVVVAFSVGALIQYLSRLLFSFNYSKRIKYFGAIWGGLAITAITYFMLIKGSKGASFMSDDYKEWILTHTLEILAICFVGWTILLQLLVWIFRLKILKMVVLVGTFALAMAFAGNDLVNFIGVPLAGFEAFKEFQANPGADPDGLSMTVLSGKVQTDTYMLIIAGLIMVATLWLSRKAKSVVKTSLDLSRQGDGHERFGSSVFARSIVRFSNTISKGAGKLTPKGLKNSIGKQFDQSYYKESIKDMEDAPAFDMVRAAVNLVVASILISFATTLKLPLSTTYVTFMVAMGTSLADKAWGRDSAVYRITGVISVIGGWFFTALSAFTVAFVVANIISWGGIVAIGLLILIAMFLIIRTHKIHKKREDKKSILEDFDEEIHTPVIISKCTSNVIAIVSKVKDVFDGSIEGIIGENRRKLKDLTKEVGEVNKQTKYLKDGIHKTIFKLQEDSLDTGPYYVQVLDYLRETTHCLTYITNPSFEYVDNNHSGFIEDQITDLRDAKNDVLNLIDNIISLINTKDYSNIDDIISEQQNLITKIESYRKKQIKRLKANEVGTKNSMLYMSIYHETKNLMLHAINLLKAHRDFINYSK